MQCRLARLPGYEPERFALRRRAAEQLERHRGAWTRDIPAWAQRISVFRRGFAAEVHTTIRELFRRGEGLFRRAPVEDAFLRCSQLGDCVFLQNASLLGRLQGLHLLSSCRGSAPLYRDLKSSPHTGKLRRLSLYLGGEGQQVGCAGAIAAAPGLAGLRELMFEGWGGGGDRVAEALAGAAHLRGLTRLRLNGCDISAAGASALLTSPALPSLTRLELPVNRIDARGAARLAPALASRRLTELNLNCQRTLGDAGAEALAASPGMESVEVLRLLDCGIGAGGARAIASSAHLKNLRYLELGFNLIGDEGALALAQSPHLGRLTLLGLQRSDLGAAGAEALLGSPALPGLFRLLAESETVGQTAWQRLKAQPGSPLRSPQEVWEDNRWLSRTGEVVSSLDDLTRVML